jgi:15-cis-phytoene synthase
MQPGGYAETGKAALIETLPLLQRLALAYAPAATRPTLVALLALDARLSGIVRNSHEPMLAQLRLAWWREALGGTGARPGSGESLLAALEDWPAPRDALTGLVSGWEAMIGAAPLPADAFLALAEARGGGFAALAGEGDRQGNALRMGRNWALADIAAHLSHPAERQSAHDLARAQDWRRAPLPRGLRPLAVLHGLAAREILRDVPSPAISPLAALVAMRIGLLGR